MKGELKLLEFKYNENEQVLKRVKKLIYSDPLFIEDLLILLIDFARDGDDIPDELYQMDRRLCEARSWLVDYYSS